MSERGYYRGSLLVPLPAHLLLAAPHTSWDGVMAASLYLGTLPYLVWAAVMFLLIGRLSLAGIRRLVWLAPVTYLLVFSVVFPVIGLVAAPPGERAEAIPLALGGIMMVLAPFILAFGYLWVVVVSLGWLLARRYLAKEAAA